MSWLWLPVEQPQRARGDGGPRRAPQTPRRSERPGEAGTLLDTAQSGRYDFTISIHEPGGRVRRVTTPVEVVSQADFDRELNERWNDLREALRRGDVAAALLRQHSSVAIYEMVRDSRSFEVRFVIDSDGVWRLEAM